MQNQDQVVETKTCTHCQSHFEITQWDMDFYDKISPTFQTSLSEGEGSRVRFQIPTPTLCPNCRQRRRLSFRNERKLYRRQCDASQKSIISMYAPSPSETNPSAFGTSPYQGRLKVYDQTIWWSDSRDPMDYGMNFDFSKSFTENFGELMVNVPRLSLINMNSENSEYCNPWLSNKNCYMVNSITNSEWCVYGRRVDSCDFCFDCYAIESSQHCSNSIQLKNCFSCHFSSQLEDCSNCWWCVWLMGKSYYINNNQYSKEEYFNQIKNTSTKIKEPIPQLFDIWNENCLDCKIIFNSSNCISCSDVRQSSDLTYCEMVKPWCYDCIDCTLLIWSKLNKEVMSTLRIEKCIGAISCWDGINIFYCDNCYNCSDCFGCIWLRNKQYCIFNKQYTKEEYEEQVAKIIQHMMTTGERGEFFHPSLSPFGYNETVAQEYFPLHAVGTQYLASDLEDVCDTSLQWINFANFGYKRSTYESPTPQVDKVIKWQDLPDSITDVNDDILKVAIQCEVSGKPFRIIPQELAFYRKHNIPLPRKHPDVRHLERMELRK